MAASNRSSRCPAKPGDGPWANGPVYESGGTQDLTEQAIADFARKYGNGQPAGRPCQTSTPAVSTPAVSTPAGHHAAMVDSMLQWWTHWAEYYRHAVAAAIADDPADLLNNDNYNDLDNNCLDNNNPEFEVVGPDPEFEVVGPDPEFFEAVDPDPELFEADPDPGFFEVVYEVGGVLHSTVTETGVPLNMARLCQRPTNIRSDRQTKAHSEMGHSPSLPFSTFHPPSFPTNPPDQTLSQQIPDPRLHTRHQTPRGQTSDTPDPHRPYPIPSSAPYAIPTGHAAPVSPISAPHFGPGNGSCWRTVLFAARSRRIHEQGQEATWIQVCMAARFVSVFGRRFRGQQCPQLSSATMK